ncbi:ABC transporter ATP-binding protein [Cryptosporangium sp. NPDC051539]|uniref:ABC transporter ATP-binding protein n=1 Tax=Cryptosporangium sp. NPDC051539 TaxID=3363962 RepID=UPI00379106EB
MIADVEASTAVAFEGVDVVFPDGTRALSAVDLGVRRGEFVSLVGPSGCGKSTLLRLAAGLVRPTSGLVRNGSRELGYVFQDATLLPWRTVADNVGLLPQLRRVARRERHELVSAAIQTVGLRGFEDSYPRTLSGGMKMRVSLARALTLDPDLFLFDEPFGALDEMTRERLNDEVLRLFQVKGFAGIFVTHSVPEATFLSTRVIVLSSRPGRIVADIPVGFDYPRSSTLRFDPAFNRVAAAVSDALRN